MFSSDLEIDYDYQRKLQILFETGREIFRCTDNDAIIAGNKNSLRSIVAALGFENLFYKSSPQKRVPHHLELLSGM